MTITKEKKRMLLLVCFMGVFILAAGYYFGFRWINDARELTDRKAADLYNKVEKVRKTIETGDAAEKKMGEIDEVLAPLLEQAPSQSAETWFANTIYAVANKHGLTLKGSRMVEPEPFVFDQVKGFSRVGLEGYGFGVQGNYFQLGEFLADLENSYPLMVVEYVAITAGAGGAANIHDMAVKVSMVTLKAEPAAQKE